MAPTRREWLGEGEAHHVFNRSIAGFRIFSVKKDFDRVLELADYYRFRRDRKFSTYKRFPAPSWVEKEKLVEIISYCIMPTHFHFILRGSCENSVSDFVRKISDSYTRYFNLSRGRKGPLWEGRFKNVRVTSDEQLVHLTRYIHLNPVTARLTEKPESWEFSSYNLFINPVFSGICEPPCHLSKNPAKYSEFVNERINEQRKLDKIKHLTLD